MEAHVKMAGRLYSCRDSCKRLFGHHYLDEMQPYMNLIKAAMQKHSIDCEIKAAMHLIEESESNSGVFAIKVLAAAVEIVEPYGTPHTAP